MNRIIKLITLLILFFALPTTSALGKEEKAVNQWINLIDQIKKSIVFLGNIDEKGDVNLRATGFLVEIHGVFHLVTAKHVVMEKKDNKFTGKFIDEGMLVFFNAKDKRIAIRPINDIKQTFAVNWMFHDNKNVDIAIIPFGLDPEKDDVKTIPENMFLTTDRLFELYDVFFLSYQPGIQPQKRISPVIRSGTISLINDDKTFYIDAFAFPGNSGSPVFLKPSPIRFDEGGISIGADQLGGKFIGVIGAYLPYQEVAISTQTLRPRVVFEENTGLAVVWSVNFINETAETNKFKQQLERLQKK